MTTLLAATLPILETRTRYSSCPPASAGPPPTTATCLVIESNCALPTAISVGWSPLASMPSASVNSAGSSLLSTLPWLLMIVPDVAAGPGALTTPSFTVTSKLTTAMPPVDSVPLPVVGNGGVRSDELTSIPPASGETTPPGGPNGIPFKLALSGL